MSLATNARSVPLYRADRSLCALVNEQRLERLESAGLVARVVRSRTGQIKRAILFARPDEPKPQSPAAYLGTRYSFREPLDSGSRCWKLRRMELKDEDGEALDARSDFQRVVEDCVVDEAVAIQTKHNPTRSREAANP